MKDTVSNKTKSPPAKQNKVWDAPTRIFHWSIVCLIAVSWFSADQGHMQTHLWSGLAVFALLVFRILWGFVGSTTAQFANFIRMPGEVLGYLAALFRRETPLYAGHNPAGGLMVVVMLTALLFQVITGLFANDGGQFHGPFGLQISAELSDTISRLHGLFFNGLIFLIWMHLVAIFFYFFVKNENLIIAMLTGKKRSEDLPADTRIKFTNWAYALALFSVIAGAIAIFVA